MVYCKEDQCNASEFHSSAMYNEQNMNRTPAHSASYTGNDRTPYGHTKPDVVGSHVRGSDVPISGRSDLLSHSHYPVNSSGSVHDPGLAVKPQQEQPQHAPANSHGYHSASWNQAVDYQPYHEAHQSHPDPHYAPSPNQALVTDLPAISTIIPPALHSVRRSITYPVEQAHDLAHYSRNALGRHAQPPPQEYVHDYRQGAGHAHGSHKGHTHMDMRQQRQQHNSQPQLLVINHYPEANHENYYNREVQVYTRPHQPIQQVHPAHVVQQNIANMQIQVVNHYPDAYHGMQMYMSPQQHNEQAYLAPGIQQNITNTRVQAVNHYDREANTYPQQPITVNMHGMMVYPADGAPFYQASYSKQKPCRIVSFGTYRDEARHCNHDNKLPIKYIINVEQQPINGRIYSLKDTNDRRSLDPPPVLTVSVLNATDDTYLNNPNLFMKASLVDPYTSEPIHSSDGMPAFIGNCVQSGGTMNYLNEIKLYFVVSDISIRVEGKFRLKLVLSEIAGLRSYCRAKVETDIFTVYQTRDFPGMLKSTPLTRALSDQGFRIRIRKQDRTVAKKRRKISTAAVDNYASIYSADAEDNEKEADEYNDYSDTEVQTLSSKRAKRSMDTLTAKRKCVGEHPPRPIVTLVSQKPCDKNEHVEEESIPGRYNVPGTPIPCQISSPDVENDLYRLGRYELKTEPGYESPLLSNEISISEPPATST